jgi:hypothetical protein
MRCEYVAGPSTENGMPALASAANASGGTSISPDEYDVPGKRPGKKPNARFFASRLGNRIWITRCPRLWLGLFVQSIDPLVDPPYRLKRAFGCLADISGKESTDFAREGASKRGNVTCI